MLRLCLWLFAVLSFGAQAQTIFAAASLKNALDEAAALYSSKPIISSVRPLG